MQKYICFYLKHYEGLERRVVLIFLMKFNDVVWCIRIYLLLVLTHQSLKSLYSKINNTKDPQASTSLTKVTVSCFPLHIFLHKTLNSFVTTTHKKNHHLFNKNLNFVMELNIPTYLCFVPLGTLQEPSKSQYHIQTDDK